MLDLPFNLTIIEDTNMDTIAAAIPAENPILATNGIFAHPAKIAVPTTLAGFEYILSTQKPKTPTLLVALNSEKSYKNHLTNLIHQADTDEKRANLQKQFDNPESQRSRAEKIMIPLAALHPEYEMIAVFYDEATPTPLYQHLKNKGLNLEALFKWGPYGSAKDAPKIEGAELFSHTYSFPIRSNPSVQPLCVDVTDKEDQTNIVHVVDLYDKGYMNFEGKVLFVLPEGLQMHSGLSINQLFNGAKLITFQHASGSTTHVPSDNHTAEQPGPLSKKDNFSSTPNFPR